jgi:hypothetical protein
MNGTASSARALAPFTGATASPVITVRAFPNPLHDQFLLAEFQPGQTVVEILGRADLPAICIADGRVIDCLEWSTVVPLRSLDIRRVPAGGDAMRTIGMVAILALAMWAGPVAAGALFANTMVSAGFLTGMGAVLTAGFGIAGMLLLNHLIPPPSVGGAGLGETQQLGWLTAQSNRVASFAPVPVLYGRMRFYPPVPMTALPYTELVGDDQYLRILYVLGYGPLEIAGRSTADGLITHASSPSVSGAIRIADTLISEFDDVEYQIGAADQVTLYTGSVVEQAVGANIPQLGTPATGVWVADGSTFTRTTDSDADEISIDLFAPALFSLNTDNGKIRGATVEFKVEARKVSISPIVGWHTLASQWRIYNEDRDPVRIGRRFDLPSRGTWEVRLTRVATLLGKSDESYTTFSWTVLRSIKRNVRPFDIDGTIVMALRIRATDQLGGRLETLSLEATRILPVWDGEEWVDTATRNPAWAYADVLSGSATRNAIAKSRLDVDAIAAWAAWCEEEGLYCDTVIDSPGTVFDRARDVASAGLGSWHVADDGGLSVVRDVVAEPVLLVSPRNSAEYVHEYTYPEIPHCLRVQFIDPDRWEPTERLVYADGYDPAGSPHSTPTRFEQLVTFGVTDAAQAWKIGRYHMAQLTLRPETYSWKQDIQHLVAGRGQCVELAHDVILVGLRWGRIKTIAPDYLSATVDEFLPMSEFGEVFEGLDPGSFDPDSFGEDSSTYALRIQLHDGSFITRTIYTVAPGTTAIEFASPATGVQAGDHFVFGASGIETIKAKITRIEPQGNFQARVVAMPAADDIFDGWDGEIPEFDPVITDPVNRDRTRPPVPTFVSLLQDSSPDPDGKPTARLVATFTVPPGYESLFIDAEYRVVGFEQSEAAEFYAAISEEAISFTPELTSTIEPEESRWRHAGFVRADAGHIVITGLEAGVAYEVRIRSRRADVPSAWAESRISAVTIATPAPPTSFAAAPIAEGIRVTWNMPTNIAAIDYVKLYAGTTARFVDASLIYQGRNTAHALALSPGAARRFWIVSTLWDQDSARVGPVSATAGELDWQSIGGEGVDDAILNARVVSSSGESAVAFRYDGTDFQTQRTEIARYTYDEGGTYQYANGSEAADAAREYPWLDVPMHFYRGGELIKTLLFRHLCNYGREDTNARIGTRCRSVWLASSGSADDSEFDVQIGAATARAKWSGDQLEDSGGDGAFETDAFETDAFDPDAFDVALSGHHVYLESEYGGSLSDYVITVTHTPSGTVAKQIVTLSATASVPPYYDYGGGGGGYK